MIYKLSKSEQNLLEKYRVICFDYNADFFESLYLAWKIASSIDQETGYVGLCLKLIFHNLHYGLHSHVKTWYYYLQSPMHEHFIFSQSEIDPHKLVQAVGDQIHAK